MAHSRINQNAMFDWIERCLAEDAPLPDDDAIMERFTLHSREQARTILADLADQGRITIRWRDGGRTIALGRQKSDFSPVRLVAPSVVRRDGKGDRVRVAPDAVLAQPFRHLGAHGAAYLSPAAPATASSASEGEQPAAEQARIEPAPPIASPPRPEITGEEPGTTAAARPKVENRKVPRGKNVAGPGKDRQVGASPEVKPERGGPLSAPCPPRTDRRQLNVHLTPDAFGRLQALALSAGRSPGGLARAVVSDWIDRNEAVAPVEFERGKKPFLSADVIRAAREAGQPLDVFVTALIQRGFAAYRTDQSRRAAA